MKSKRLVVTLVVSVVILFIPLIAMQFTTEVNWTFMDFVVAAILLLGTGLLLELVLRKVKNLKYKVMASVALLFLLMLVWAQLAVGIF